MANISFAITVADEHLELDRLLNKLTKSIPTSDEIVILCDEAKVTDGVKSVIAKYNVTNVYYHMLNNNFADHKNFLNSQCTKEWIFQIDADEEPHDNLLLLIHDLLDMNDEIDAFWISRVNMVNGLTKPYIRKWGWVLNEYNWINWPDPQMRIYKNSPNIKWYRPVHEILKGYEKYGVLPQDREYALYHIKDFERQKRQNEMYDQIMGR